MRLQSYWSAVVCQMCGHQWEHNAYHKEAVTTASGTPTTIVVAISDRCSRCGQVQYHFSPYVWVRMVDEPEYYANVHVAAVSRLVWRDNSWYYTPVSGSLLI